MSERKKAARFQVRIVYPDMGGGTREGVSTHLTKAAAEKLRLEWVRNGHPEATVIEDTPPSEKKVGRMSGT